MSVGSDLVFAEFVASWRPSRQWASTVRAAAGVIASSPPGQQAVDAWCQVAMMLGDSGAGPLALIVCLHVERTTPEGCDLERLHSHRNICLLELGLAAPVREGLVPIRELHTIVDEISPTVDQWLAGALEPFGGNLEQAARFVLTLTLARLGLADEPPWPS